MNVMDVARNLGRAIRLFGVNMEKKEDMSNEDFNAILDILAKYNSNSLDEVVILLKALRNMGFENIKV